jgi:hypothetical protein
MSIDDSSQAKHRQNEMHQASESVTWIDVLVEEIAWGQQNQSAVELRPARMYEMLLVDLKPGGFRKMEESEI